MQPFLYLARHGQTDLNARNGLQGHIDMPLNRNGEAHAAALAAYFKDRELTAIWASPLQRARNTAAAVAASHDLPVQIDADLIEVDYGDIDGMTMDDATASTNYRDRDQDRLAYRPPNGETYYELLARLERFFTKPGILEENPKLVVAHQGIMRMTCAYFKLFSPIESAWKNFGHQSIITFYRGKDDQIDGQISEVPEYEKI